MHKQLKIPHQSFTDLGSNLHADIFHYKKSQEKKHVHTMLINAIFIHCVSIFNVECTVDNNNNKSRKKHIELKEYCITLALFGFLA